MTDQYENFAQFVTDPPDWPPGVEQRKIIGIRCPRCGHEKHDAALVTELARWVTCGECGWRGRVPL